MLNGLAPLRVRDWLPMVFDSVRVMHVMGLTVHRLLRIHLLVEGLWRVAVLESIVRISPVCLELGLLHVGLLGVELPLLIVHLLAGRVELLLAVLLLVVLLVGIIIHG